MNRFESLGWLSMFFLLFVVVAWGGVAYESGAVLTVALLLLVILIILVIWEIWEYIEDKYL